MANLSSLLSASIIISDISLSPSPQIITRSLNNPTNASTTVVFYDPFFQAAAGGSAVTLPAATCWIAYVKNLDAAANLTVAWTPAGGVSSSFILVPSGLFIYFQPTEGAGGFTAMTLTASAGTINTEVLVAK